MTDETATKAKPRRRRGGEKRPDTAGLIGFTIPAASGEPNPEAARIVLEKQAKLIDRQAELAEAQCAELRLRNFSERIRAALWGMLGIAALALVVMIVAVAIRAWRSNALVVQSFRVPPAVAAKGLTGEVIATQVLDRLAEMQARTNSVRAASTYANNWEDEFNIEIPNTGTTTDEVWKLLRNSLGKETRISGEVIESKGLSLVARIGASPARRFHSPTSDLDSLVAESAEFIYRETQPYRFAIFVARDGREAERYPVLKQLTADESTIERKWAFSGLSFDLNGRGRFNESVAMARRALALDQQMAPALANGALAHGRMGHDQAALDMYRQAMRQIGKGQYEPKVRERARCGYLGEVARYSMSPADFESAAVCYESMEGFDAISATSLRTNAALLRHEPGPALALRADALPGFPAEEAARFNAWNRLRGQIVLGPTRALDTALQDFRKVAQLPSSLGFLASHYRAAAQTQDWPVEAEALVMLGRVAEARALIFRTPQDCYQCARVRGMVVQATGDADAAERWFAEAVRQGPRLPAAYVDSGRLLASRRRYQSAEAHLRRAAQLAPNWADPLKYWGDLQAAQGKLDEARRKYDAALELAPRWKELRQARARLRVP